MDLRAALAKAWSELQASDPVAIEDRCGVVYDRGPGGIMVPFFLTQYTVHTGTKTFSPEPGLQEQVLILHYLLHASGTPLTGRWISFRELPGGSLYMDAFRRRALLPLMGTFGNSAPGLLEAAAAYGREVGEWGHASVILRPFPRVPVGVVVWEGDEELPANASILFDSSAPDYLPTEDYAVLAGLIATGLARAAGSSR
ncbi:MAG: DUF3786 domain-containing protein [Clostridia bacterium]|nr:MAG: DUF3786 domain-containing protein [Clostridia bacterium]